MNQLDDNRFSSKANAVTLPELAHRHEASRRQPVDSDIKIAIRKLDFFYGKTQALRNINLDIRDQGVMALIGPSGCGKSTLLRTLNRLYDLYPDQRATGTIAIDDVDILDAKTNLESLRARVGMTFQMSTPFPMSIFQNIALGISVLFQPDRAECAMRVEKALRAAALWDEVKDILGKPARSLSGGQQQRLCIARTIAMEPDILLFDEPCSALDPLSTARIETLINDLAQRYCVVIVTHNMEQAARVGDVAAFMYLGEVIEVGATEQIFADPRDKRTRDFVRGRFG